MKKLLFIGIFILSTLLSFAEKKTIIVVDKNTKEELIGAKVIINDSIYYTNFDGFVVIDTNDSIVKIEYPSYVTKTSKLTENQIIELTTK